MNVVNSVQEQDICNLFIAKLISPDFYFPLSTFHESKITKPISDDRIGGGVLFARPTVHSLRPSVKMKHRE